MDNSTISSSGFRERERLAWTVLLAAAGTLLVILIGTPVAIFEWIQRATTDPVIVLQALQGSAQVEQPDESARLLLPSQAPIGIPPGSKILNDAEGETVLTISTPDGLTALGTVQIYPGTQLEITVARSPRYASSKEPHRLEVTILAGRIRLLSARVGDRGTEFRAHTPQAQFLLWQTGSYSLDVSPTQAQVTVREGLALIYAPRGQLQVEEDQRALVGNDGVPVGPLRPERDLIANGHFRRPLGEGWEIRQDAADPGQPDGTVEIVTSAGKEAVRLYRAGTGHAETGIYQLLNQILRDYRTLQLHLSARIDDQSLGVCGVLGSECPLMLRIDYADAAGNPRQWVQGFYYWVDPAAPNPTLCETCPPPRQEHEQHAQGTQFFYDSPNLIETLSSDGNPPARITAIAVYASGHTYDVQVGEIELLVGE